MPDEDTETRYYDEATGQEIWRCAYCPKVYRTSSGTRSAEEHLTSHGLAKGDPRGSGIAFDSTRQQTLVPGFKRQIELSVDQTFKRRNMGITDGSSIDPNLLEVYYTLYVILHVLTLANILQVHFYMLSTSTTCRTT